MKTLIEIKQEMQNKIAEYPVFKNDKASLEKNLTEALDLAFIGSLYQDNNEESFIIAKQTINEILEFVNDKNSRTQNDDEMTKELYNLFIEFSNNYHIVNKLIVEEEKGLIEVNYNDNNIEIKQLKQEKIKDNVDLTTQKVTYTEIFAKYAKEVKGGKIKYFILGNHCGYIYDELVEVCTKEAKDLSRNKFKDFTFADLMNVIAGLNFLSIFKLTANMQNLAVNKLNYMNHLETPKQELISLLCLLTKLDNDIINNVIDYITINPKKANKAQCLFNIANVIVYSPANIINLFNNRVLEMEDFTYEQYSFKFIK